jgi:hypothetical protein
VRLRLPCIEGKVANRTAKVAQGDRNWPLNDGQIPNFRVVRVALCTGYSRVEGNRRASRNGRVSDLRPETPNFTIRNCFIAVSRCLDRVPVVGVRFVCKRNPTPLTGAPALPADLAASMNTLQEVIVVEHTRLVAMTQQRAAEVRFLGDAKSSLGDAKRSLGDAESSLGDAKSSLGDAESSLGDVKSSLGDAKSSLGDAKSSLGDA